MNSKIVLLALTTATLAACSNGPGPRPNPTGMPTTAPPTATSYNATGAGWNLTIDQAGMYFVTNQGLATRDPVATFKPHPDGDIYQGSKMTVTVHRQGCALEGMDTMVYPHTVTVAFNGQTYQGCGGPPGGNDRSPY
ncbi:hypothetical protein [Sphingomicrobium nitratireducens]|uniref:hypothetical protein n=1 Tax=Sphingomicrobium nitratireducens TaxID=2964666 RepID=UPI00223F982D|nr:hypothetical protein [Sphingomicrobium nitratireducens]